MRSLYLSLFIIQSAAYAGDIKTYDNTLKLLENPAPILADYPEYFQPIVELRRYEAPMLVNDEGADLEVRAWRWSYNARGIVEMPNKIRMDRTSVIVVHPWGIDDGQGWNTPEPAGVADFCTIEKNELSHDHIRRVLVPFIKMTRGKAQSVMYSLPGPEDPIRKKLYRSVRSGVPSEDQRREAQRELEQKLKSFSYKGEPIPAKLTVSSETPVIDYFKQFPGLDATAKYNNEGFWDLPIPVVRAIEMEPEDIVIYDAEGYPVLRDYLKANGVRHVLLLGYATDMCYKATCAGYENLSKDFNVFLVGDASMATFPANSSPAYATNAAISFASLNQLVTQVSWIRFIEE
jgi:nicotinamidase-related amidase